jgi:hypothetical protein
MNLPPGARIVERNGEKLVVSTGVTDDQLATFDRYEDDRSTYGGPAEQMVAFLKPFLDKANGDPEAIKRVMTFGTFWWNAAVIRDDDERAAMIDRVVAQLSGDDHERARLRAGCEMMVERHRELFPHLHEG